MSHEALKTEEIFSLEKDVFSLRRLSVSEYHRMSENDILKEDEQVELIEGIITKMSPKGTKHSAVISRLSVKFYEPVLQNKVILRVQDSIVLNDMTEPEPDIAVVKFRDDYYSKEHPHPNDVLLLIEVADTSLERDREVKLPLYAASGIPEVWIVNLVEKVIEVYRESFLLPDGTYRYRIQENFTEGDEISPQAFPEEKISVDSIIV